MLRTKIDAAAARSATFASLSEAARKDPKDVVDRLFDSIRRRYDQLDASDIHASRGDVRKIKNYKYLREAADYCRDMLSKAGDRSKEAAGQVEQLSTALDNLEKMTKPFGKAYEADSKLGQMLYVAAVISVVSSATALIAVTADYIRRPDGSYIVAFRDSAQPKVRELEVHIGQLRRFNELVQRGDARMFLDKVGEVKTESALLSEDFGAVLFGGAMFLAVLMSVLFLVRYAVYFYFRVRQGIADYLDHVREFVEMNIATLGAQGGSKAVIEKQKRYAERLDRLARKLEVKTASASNDAEKEAREDDKKIAATASKEKEPGPAHADAPIL